MTRVLVAVDDSPASVAAARAARDLFGDAEFVAVNVANTPVPWVEPGLGWGGAFAVHPATWPGFGTLPSDPAVDRSVLETARAEAETAAKEAGIEAQPMGKLGDPASAVLAAAHECKADVVVVGSHSRSWWEKLLGPSVSAGVVKAAHVPVLVVHTDDHH